MPCRVCGEGFLITQPLLRKSLCPNCHGLRVIEHDMAITISIQRLLDIFDLFMRYVKQFKKTRLIMHIVWQREKFARSCFDNYPEPINLSMTVAFSYLIQCLMREDSDGTLEVDESSTLALVGLFDRYLDLVTEHLYLLEGYAQLLAIEPFQFSTLTMERKQKNFIIAYTEAYIPLLQTFANNEIYTEEEGREKTQQYREEWERLRLKLETESKVDYRPQKFIKTSYALLNTFYCGLLKNVVYANTFDFSNYIDVVKEPIQILELAKGFLASREAITVTSLAEFRNALRHVFKSKWIEAESILLYSSTNTNTFPLFLLLGGRVFISHRMTFIIFILLHPILLKDYFHNETVRRSKELETARTKDAFEKEGFKWVPNVTDKKKATLEIDGLAGRNGTLFVVEVKARGLTTFYEHKNRRDQLIRDLKGVVDGTHFKLKDGEPFEEKVPSLLEKIEYVKSNMSQHGFDPNVFKTVTGVVVIKDFPPINGYKGVKMIGLNEIPSL